jgi:hypothetical protein
MATKSCPIRVPTGPGRRGTWPLRTLGVNGSDYGVAEGLAGEDVEEGAPADWLADADADPDADALPDVLGAAEKLGSGAGVGDGKRVVGTFASESAKIRMKMASTISTHGRASVSVRGGSAPR